MLSGKIKLSRRDPFLICNLLQVQLQKSSLKPGKVSKIFITHLHGDHLFGLPGLLLTLGNNADENKVVDVFGPHGIRKYITTCLELSRSPIAFKLNVHELMPEADMYPDDWNTWSVDHELTSDHPQDTSSTKILPKIEDPVLVYFH